VLHAVHGDVDQGGLERPAAALQPLGYCDFLDEVGLGLGGGPVLVDVGVQESVEFGFVLGGEDEGGGGEAMAQGVHGGASFAFVGDGSVRFSAVGARGGALGIGPRERDAEDFRH